MQPKSRRPGSSPEGASADRQLAIFAEARRGGAPAKHALAAVVDWMADATVGKTLPGSVPSS